MVKVLIQDVIAQLEESPFLIKGELMDGQKIEIFDYYHLPFDLSIFKNKTVDCIISLENIKTSFNNSDMNIFNGKYIGKVKKPSKSDYHYVYIPKDMSAIETKVGHFLISPKVNPFNDSDRGDHVKFSVGSFKLLAYKTEFTINKFIKLSFEYDETYLVIRDEFKANPAHSEKLDPLDDEFTAMENFKTYCPIIQEWVDNEYISNILGYQLTLSLLKIIAEKGDPIASKELKKRITDKLMRENFEDIRKTINNGYLECFDKEELNKLLHQIDFDKIRKQPPLNFMPYYLKSTYKKRGIRNKQPVSIGRRTMSPKLVNELVTKEFLKLYKKTAETGDPYALNLLKKKVTEALMSGDIHLILFLYISDYLNVVQDGEISLPKSNLKKFINDFIENVSRKIYSPRSNFRHPYSILKRIANLFGPNAKKVFNQEIIRILSGDDYIMITKLFNESYVFMLDMEELDLSIQDIDLEKFKNQALKNLHTEIIYELLKELIKKKGISFIKKVLKDELIGQFLNDNRDAYRCLCILLMNDRISNYPPLFNKEEIDTIYNKKFEHESTNYKVNLLEQIYNFIKQYPGVSFKTFLLNISEIRKNCGVQNEVDSDFIKELSNFNFKIMSSKYLYSSRYQQNFTDAKNVRDMSEIKMEFLMQIDDFIKLYPNDFSEKFIAKIELIKKQSSIYKICLKDLEELNFIKRDSYFYTVYEIEQEQGRLYFILKDKIGYKIANLLLEKGKLDKEIIVETIGERNQVCIMDRKDQLIETDEIRINSSPVHSMLKNMYESLNLLILDKRNDKWKYQINPEKREIITKILNQINKEVNLISESEVKVKKEPEKPEINEIDFIKRFWNLMGSTRERCNKNSNYQEQLIFQELNSSWSYDEIWLFGEMIETLRVALETKKVLKGMVGEIKDWSSFCYGTIALGNRAYKRAFFNPDKFYEELETYSDHKKDIELNLSDLANTTIKGKSGWDIDIFFKILRKDIKDLSKRIIYLLEEEFKV